MTPEIRNAIIKSASITTDDHGFLSAWLTLDYGGMGQGFGGYVLGKENGDADGAYAGVFIARCMQIAGVTKWSDIPGKTIRARVSHSKVEAIGHIVKDDWFFPGDEFAAMRRKPGGAS